MMMMSYRDYLIYTASQAAAALNDAVKTALSMSDERIAVEHLESKLDSAKLLVEYTHPNPERVEPRP